MIKTLYLLPHEELGVRKFDGNSFYWELSDKGIASTIETAKQIKNEVSNSNKGIIITPELPWYKQGAAIIHNALDLSKDSLVGSYFLDSLYRPEFLNDLSKTSDRFSNLHNSISLEYDYAVIVANEHFLDHLYPKDKREPILGYRRNGYSFTYQGGFWGEIESFEQRDNNENMKRPTSQVEYRQNIDQITSQIGFAKVKNNCLRSTFMVGHTLRKIEGFVQSSKKAIEKKEPVQPVQHNKPGEYYNRIIG